MGPMISSLMAKLARFPHNLNALSLKGQSLTWYLVT